MPFRRNAFGDKIALPGTQMGDIDLAMLDRGMIGAAIGGVDLFLEEDETYKFGGTLHLWGTEDDFDENDEPSEEITEQAMEFDGFESLDAARQWLIDTLDVPPSMIMEVN